MEHVQQPIQFQYSCPSLQFLHLILQVRPVSTRRFNSQICQQHQVVSWIPGFGISGTAQVLQFKIQDSLGCLDTVTNAITIYALPSVHAGTDQNICSGSSATLIATGGLTYVWSPGGSSSSTTVVNPVGTTNYIVTGTDSNGCAAS